MFFPATRDFSRKVDNLGISLFPKVKIGRSIALERHLMAGPGTSNNTTQNRIAPCLKTVRNVPINARGRKRKTVMFIGITPNVDGQGIVRQQTPGPSAVVTPSGNQNSAADNSSPGPSNLDGRQVADEPPVRGPAKRTYGRAASTPLVQSVGHPRPRVLSFPAVDESFTSTIQNDEAVNLQFDETFGRLHFDSSDSEEELLSPFLVPFKIAISKSHSTFLESNTIQFSNNNSK